MTVQGVFSKFDSKKLKSFDFAAVADTFEVILGGNLHFEKNCMLVQWEYIKIIAKHE